MQDDFPDPEVQAAFKELRARGTEPLNLHRVYDNAPKLARASLALAQALRDGAVVSRADRELIILRATQLARGDYPVRPTPPSRDQLRHHASSRSKAFRRGATASCSAIRQRTVLAYADAMASPDGVDDATFEAMKAFFNTKEIIELTMNAAYYGASSQISRALRITAEGNPKGGGYGTCR